ncbi:unnamed protein product, partial [Rotaria sp. Silwood2]
LFYTKSGIVGRICTKTERVESMEEQQEDRIEQNFETKITAGERLEREQIYQRQIETIRVHEKIPDDELSDIIKTLKDVVEDLKHNRLFSENDANARQHSELNCNDRDFQYQDDAFADNQEVKYHDESPEDQQVENKEEKQQDDSTEPEGQFGEGSEQENNDQVSEHQLSSIEENRTEETDSHLKYFRLSIERWLEKAQNGNANFGNLPPFTLTGDINDAPFENPYLNENPWWVRNGYIELDEHDEQDNDHFDDSTDYVAASRHVIGSWPTYDEAHGHFQNLINRDALFSTKRGLLRLQMEENNQSNEIHEQDKIEKDKIKNFPNFTTGLKRGKRAWDISEDKKLLKEYKRRLKKEKGKYRHSESELWERIFERRLKIFTDIKENRIDENLPSVQGYNDKELKTRNEIRKLNELDNTNNPRWKRRRRDPHLQKFIQKKIQNIIEFKRLCEAN